MYKKHFYLLIHTLIFIFIPSYIFAGILINPVKLELKGKTTTASLKVTNNDEREKSIPFRLQGVRWSQDEKGEDVYEPTEDLVIYPKIVSIDNGAEKIIRIGFQGQPDANMEKTYRLFLEELPVRKPGEISVQMVMRLGVPVFLPPKKENHQGEIRDVSISKGKIHFRVVNSGNAHILLSKLNITGLDNNSAVTFSKDGKGWYLLAGKSRIYDETLSRNDCLKSDRMKIYIETEQRIPLQGMVKVDKDFCEEPMKEEGKGRTVGDMPGK